MMNDGSWIMDHGVSLWLLSDGIIDNTLQAGLQGALIKTGKYQEGDEDR